MPSFSNILFSPLGGDHNLLASRRVADLATKNDAGLVFVGVVPEPSGFQRALSRPGFYDEVQESVRSSLFDKLSRWSTKVGYPNSKVAIVKGDTAECIVERVLAEGHDLVAVTSDDEDEDRRTIKRLLRMCPCPVWVIRPTRARIQRLMAAVDVDPDELELTRRILELASTMRRLNGGELYVVYAWELFGEATMRASPQLRISPAEIEAMLLIERDRQRDALIGALAAAGVKDEPWRVVLGKGRPSHVVCEAMARRRINLLVMGTLGRKGISGLVIGNTAERLLDMVHSSVIAVKPPGFDPPNELKPK